MFYVWAATVPDFYGVFVEDFAQVAVPREKIRSIHVFLNFTLYVRTAQISVVLEDNYFSFIVNDNLLLPLVAKVCKDRVIQRAQSFYAVHLNLKKWLMSSFVTKPFNYLSVKSMTMNITDITSRES